VVPEYDPPIGGHVVMAVFESLGRRLSVRVERKNPMGDQAAIESIADQIRADRRGQQPGGADLLSTLECEHRKRRGARQRDAHPDENRSPFPHVGRISVSLRAVASHRPLVMPIFAAHRSAGPRGARRRGFAPVVPLVSHRGWLVSPSLAAVVLLGITACGLHNMPDPVDLRPLPLRPGTGLSGARVIVLPLSTIRHGDALGWADGITNSRDYLVDLNAQIEHAFSEHLPHTTWIFPKELARIAAKNPEYLSDPFTLDPSQFAPDRWRPGTKVEDPLAGGLRGYTSFVDARVALLPVELRFFPRSGPPGHEVPPAERAMMRTDSTRHMGRAVLRIAVVDTRTTEVFWVGDVVGDPAPTLTPAVAANLVERLTQALTTQ
jgi:hypothetical protein